MFGTRSAAAAAPPSHAVQWYYYLKNDPRRRLPDGWYEYDATINLTVEQLFQTSQSTAGFGPHKRRHVLSMVASSGYKYELDFQRMTQRNTSSGKERPLFRTANGQPPPGPPTAAAAPAVTHVTLAPPAPHTAAFLPSAPTAPTVLHSAPGGFPFAFGGGRNSATVNRRQPLSYVAPERLHEVKLDEAKVFVDVAPPSGKPKAEEEKKNGETSYATANHDDDCVICLDALWGKGERVVAIKKCDHRFHYDCIHEALKNCGGKCPLCSKSIAEEEEAETAKGKCPSATMLATTNPSRQCSGHHGVGTIEISYRIPGGTQKDYHPQPGFGFSGANRTAYLPDSTHGRDVLARMQFAFMHGLSFMVGTSLTTGQANTVTWASIHHKTTCGGGTYGYPDPTYLNRCNDEMNQLGVPEAAACRTWLQNKCPGYDR